MLESNERVMDIIPVRDRTWAGRASGNHIMIIRDVVEILSELSPPRLLRRIEAWIWVGLFCRSQLATKKRGPLETRRIDIGLFRC